MNATFDPAYVSTLPSRATRGGDRYLVGLGIVLLGYTLIGRGFAYLGLPPLFIGEIMLVAGIATAARAGRLGPLLSGPTVWILVALMALAGLRTLPYLGAYGLDAPRDFMQIGYAVYAFVIGSLLVAKPERLVQIIRLYRRFIVAVLSTIWFVYLAYKIMFPDIPPLPWAGHVTFFEAKGGDIMVHLTAITVFMVAGFIRRSPLLILALAFNVGIVVVSNRGGMLAFFLGCLVAWFMRPPSARVGRLAFAFAVLLVVGLIVGPTVSIHDGGRSISVEQIWLNIQSVFGGGGSHLEGTRTWRLEWWGDIIAYTFGGDYFWTGRGFGINLAQVSGFDGVKELRSPHNGHLTILARMGVPGALLWIGLQVSWGLAIVSRWRQARRAGQTAWMGWFAWIAAFATAAHVNATFDVYFEGPMGGIWYWSVFGMGLASLWIYDHRPDVLPSSLLLDPGAAAPAPRPAPWSWTPPPRSDDPVAPPSDSPRARTPRPQLLSARWR